MNEETGELDGTLQTLSGDVYDLTNGKVSIMLDPETYKSPYKILQDISKIWNELTDVQQAQLSEKLFGKNRANIGVAILSNFQQAEAAMESMQNSAGAADKEMEIITNSLSYKLNALRETGTGIWQNLIPREGLGGVVSDLTTLLGVIEKFTDKVGLLGTVLSVGAFAIGITKAYTFFKQLSSGATLLHSLAMAFPALGNAVKIFNANMAQGTGLLTAFGTSASSLALALAPLLVLLGALAVHKGYQIFDDANSSWTKAQESAEKAVNSYQDAQKQLDDLNSQQNEQLTQVQEIAAKYDIDVQGIEDVDEMIEKINSSDKGITLVDQAELEKISSANHELEAQLRIQEQIAKIQKESAISETEKAASTEKSYWEEVRGRHGDGLLGTAASVWEYFSTRGQGWASEEGSVEEQYIERDTTNLGLAKQAYQDLISKKQELADLDKEIEQTSGDLTQEQIDKRAKLVEEISDQGRKTATLAGTVKDELKWIRQSGSDFAKDYVPDAEKLIRDISNIGASPAEAALNNLNAFFDGTSGKNAIKEQLIEAAKSGEDLESTLRGLGLSLEDLDISDASYLNDYFADLAKEVEKADDEVNNFGKTVEDVEAASKTEDADSDWKKIQAAYKKASEYYEEGKTGIDDFKSVAQFMSSKNLGELAKQAKDAGGYAADVYQKAFEDARAKADRWFGDDEAQSLMNFADDAESSGLFNINKNDEKGLWDISVAEGFENTAQAAEKLGTSVGVVETMLDGLEAYGYDFEGIKKSGEMFEEYGQTLDALNQTYENMADGRGKDRLNELLNGENGFNKQYEQFEGDLSKLSEEQVIHIKFEYDLASIQSKIDEIQRLIEGGMDDDVATHAALISERDKYTETAERGLGLDKEGVVLPVEYELSKQSEQSLKDQLHNTTDKDTRLELQAEIENEQEVQQQILNDFADAHPEITPEMSVEDINEALASTFSDNTIHFNATVDGVESQIQAVRNEDGTITYTANIDGVETEVEPVTNEDGTITYTAEIENEVDDKELDKKGKIEYDTTVNDTASAEDKSAKVTYTKDSSAVDSYQATDKQAKVSFTADTKAADGYKPQDKQAKVTFGKDSNIPDGYKPSDKHATVVYGKDSSSPDGYSPSNKSATVTYTANTSSLPTSFSTITRYVNYVKTGAVSVDGTAHANGTAYARGTAFAHGYWGTKGSGIAIGGEENPEILVRNGSWMTIGDQGAEFFAYKKGDIRLCPHTVMCA